ncbi:hypothetical protein [Clostridium tarantellae]|uniref:Uncharacterized protein n=1 Tax=Clostridium tarantellae TaxID=39493 RepID=A0A6I1MYC6_9CLOT|nr:hypothetical protein [Clostridium tarantellae]MPQ45129.1 hypothetical protein [Clostridium tarantellae]
MKKYSKTFNKSLIGIVLGAIIGLFNSVPMITENIPKNLVIATFLTWIVIGYIFSITTINIHDTLKGFIISIILFIPLASFILTKNPFYALWIIIMSLIWGSLLGYLYKKISKDA